MKIISLYPLIHCVSIPMPDKFEKRLTLAAWLIVPPLFGLLSVMMGQDANWDLRNYHFYNPYSFIYGRMDFDVLPSQVANFYNPLLYVPFYYAVDLLSPKWVGFLLGWIQGFNFPLLLAIARTLIPAIRTVRIPPGIRERSVSAYR